MYTKKIRKQKEMLHVKASIISFPNISIFMKKTLNLSLKIWKKAILCNRQRNNLKRQLWQYHKHSYQARVTNGRRHSGCSTALTKSFALLLILAQQMRITSVRDILQ